MNNTIENEEVRKVQKEMERLAALANALIYENKLAGETISNLEKRVAEQDTRIAEKSAIIASLEEQSRKAKISKDRSNRSKPPSSDMAPRE